jgi:hypothetical protein
MLDTYPDLGHAYDEGIASGLDGQLVDLAFDNGQWLVTVEGWIVHDVGTVCRARIDPRTGGRFRAASLPRGKPRGSERFD